MDTFTFTQRTNVDYLPSWIEAFLIDRKARKLSPGTSRFYRQKLLPFQNFCEANLVTDVRHISPSLIRTYFLTLEEKGLDTHSYYRAIKAFLRWYEDELEPEGWKNPIKKIHAPKIPDIVLPPVDIRTVFEMVAGASLRDKAILLTLLDTGVRASELSNITLECLNLALGSLFIASGKGNKSRTVFFGKRAKRAILAHLKENKPSKYLFETREGNRISYDGLRGIIVRRSKLLPGATPSLHSFRRAFALNMLRNGVDLLTLSKLLGHSDLSLLRRYVRLVPEDLQLAHSKGSPVDNF